MSASMNTLSFAGLAVGVPTLLPHALVDSNGRALVPDIIWGSAAGFTITADATNVTVTRLTAGDPDNVVVYVVHWHSEMRNLPPPLTDLVPQPFIPALGGAGITGSGTDERLMRWNGANAAQDSAWALTDAGVMTAGGQLNMGLNAISFNDGNTTILNDNVPDTLDVRIASTDLVRFNTTGIQPLAANTFDFGGSGNRWRTQWWKGAVMWGLTTASASQSPGDNADAIYEMDTAATTFNLPNITASRAGRIFFVMNSSGGVVTISPDASDSINGGVAGASVSLPAGNIAMCVSDAASDWQVCVMPPAV